MNDTKLDIIYKDVIKSNPTLTKEKFIEIINENNLVRIAVLAMARG